MKKLSVHNFGPIQEVDIELRDINLFIGEQSVGKSTLAKLISILTDHIILLSIIKGGLRDWNLWLQKYNLNIYKDNDYRIVYEFSLKELFFHFEVSPLELSTYIIRDGEKITDSQEIFAEIAGSKPIYHDDAFEVFMKYLENKSDNDDRGFKAFVNLMNNSLYIPAERIIYCVISNLFPALTFAKSSVPGNLLRFMIDLENAKAEYPEFDMPLLGISYKQDGGDDYFVINGKDSKFPISSASSGIQSTMPLLQVIHYAINHKEYSTFVIEEPECNLFPDKQVELLEYILKLIKDGNRTLTITTHSPYILSAMNNYLFAGNLAKLVLDDGIKSLDEVLDRKIYVLPSECSVYSLGENINGEGIYCKSLQDVETGMIDFNTLDAISGKLSVAFEELEDIYVNLLKK